MFYRYVFTGIQVTAQTKRSAPILKS